jgi:hypothetical protein
VDGELPTKTHSAIESPTLNYLYVQVYIVLLNALKHDNSEPGTSHRPELDPEAAATVVAPAHPKRVARIRFSAICVLEEKHQVVAISLSDGKRDDCFHSGKF